MEKGQQRPSAYNREEQAEIVGDAINDLRDAIGALECLSGDDAEAAVFDAHEALLRALKVKRRSPRRAKLSASDASEKGHVESEALSVRLDRLVPDDGAYSVHVPTWYVRCKPCDVMLSAPSERAAWDIAAEHNREHHP